MPHRLAQAGPPNAPLNDAVQLTGQFSAQLGPATTVQHHFPASGKSRRVQTRPWSRGDPSHALSALAAVAAVANRRSLLPPACRRLLPRLQPRFQVILLCFLATLTAYVERVGFSIAWTGMCSQVGGRPLAGRQRSVGRRCRRAAMFESHSFWSPSAGGRGGGRQGSSAVCFLLGLCGVAGECCSLWVLGAVCAGRVFATAVRLLFCRCVLLPHPPTLRNLPSTVRAGAGRLGGAALGRRARAQLVVCGVEPGGALHSWVCCAAPRRGCSARGRRPGSGEGGCVHCSSRLLLLDAPAAWPVSLPVLSPD